ASALTARSRCRRSRTPAAPSSPARCRSPPGYLPSKQNGPGVSFARAEEPLPPPSLKWTAIVAPSSDDASLAAAEVPDAEDVRAVRDLHRGAGGVAGGDERAAG